ncbi:MAG: GxxExxY protein [Planctomycetaceae bacterium]|nr:GxxExxY protein [Planctomycetaceae bacterium]
MIELLYKEESYAILGACFEVYNYQGSGFVEPVYQDCLGIEFEMRALPFVAEPRLTLQYKGRKLNSEYIPDFTCAEKIIVEIKAVTALNDQHRAQVHNYLKATGYRLGLLINFGSHPNLEYERIIR